MRLLEQPYKATIYLDGCLIKRHNTSVRVVRHNEDFFIQTRIISTEEGQRAVVETFHKVMHQITTRYSQEGLEALLICIAETLGYDLVERKNKTEECQCSFVFIMRDTDTGVPYCGQCGKIVKE